MTSSPLTNLEKEIEEFNKEINEKVKIYKKYDLKSFNKDKITFREELEKACTILREDIERSKALVVKVTELKKEDEETLKEKEFIKRRDNAKKNAREAQTTVTHCNGYCSIALNRLRAEIEKDEKAKEKKDQKKKDPTKSASNSAINETPAPSAESKSALGGLIGIFKKNTDKSKSQEIKQEVQTNDDQYDEDDEDLEDDDYEDDEEELEDPSKKPKGLKEMISETKAKSDKKLLKKEAKNEGKTVQQPPSGLSTILTESLAKEKKVNTTTETKIGPSQGLSSIISEIKAKEKMANQSHLDEKNNFGDTEEEEEEEEEGEELSKAYEKHIENKEKNEEIMPVPNKISFKDLMKNKKNESNKFPLVQKNEAHDTDNDDDEVGEEVFERGASKKQTSSNLQPAKSQFDKEFKEGDKLRVISGFIPELDDDLEVVKDEIVEFIDFCEEDEWIEVKNKLDIIGLIPRDRVEKLSESEKTNLKKSKSTDSARSGAELWGKAKENLQNKGVLSLSPDALKHSGSVPSSFSDSILGQNLKNPKYLYSNFLRPKLSKSNLNFENLHWESKEHKVRSKLVQFQKLFTIRKCINIPVPNKDLEILKRCVRICLFDGSNIQSNIHEIRAHIVGKDYNTWVFDDENTDMVPLFDFSEFFVRSMIEEHLGVLFELSINCKIKNTNEETELCCGWTHLPFKDPTTKNQITNKNYDLILNGGSIFDRNIALDPETAKTRTIGTFNELYAKMFKESKIKFNVKEPNNQFFETLNCLPYPLIASTLVAPFIKYYEESVCSQILAPLIEFGSFDVSTEPIHSPFMKWFPQSLIYPDILNAGRINFNMMKEHMKRDDRNDNQKCREAFIKLFNEICYPLMHHNALPDLALSDHDAIETIIDRMAKANRKNKTLDYLLDDSETFHPFSIEELRFDILSN